MRADQRRAARPGTAWWVRALWAGVPAVGAAVVALMVFTGGPRLVDPEAAAASWAQFVEVDATDSDAVVFVDETSGWVVVWAGESGDGRS